MKPTLAHPLLPRFLVLSIALHACLLAVFTPSLLIEPDLHPGDSVLEINFYEVTYAPTQIPIPKLAPAPPKTDNIITQSAKPVKRIANVSPADSNVDIGDPHAPTATSDKRENLRNQLLGAVKTRLSQYLSYPSLARNRGWEGTVLLGMRVESDGHLQHLRIDRSSGYTVLDHSALNSLRRVGHLAEAAAWLKGRELDMQLPVIYRLIDD